MRIANIIVKIYSNNEKGEVLLETVELVAGDKVEIYDRIEDCAVDIDLYHNSHYVSNKTIDYDLD